MAKDQSGFPPLFSLQAVVLALAGTPLAGAVKAASEPSLCLDAARLAAAEADVPEGLMLAITLAESGRSIDGIRQPWPWAMNRAGTGTWHPSRTSLLDAARTALADGDDLMDLGCFQMSLRWHGGRFTSLEEMVDPVSNARAAAAFLAELHSETGSWEEAAAAYHSRTFDLGQAYVARLREVAAEGTASAEDPGQVADERPYPLLVPGPTNAGSLVPLTGGARPLVGG